MCAADSPVSLIRLIGKFKAGSARPFHRVRARNHQRRGAAVPVAGDHPLHRLLGGRHPHDHPGAVVSLTDGEFSGRRLEGTRYAMKVLLDGYVQNWSHGCGVRAQERGCAELSDTREHSPHQGYRRKRRTHKTTKLLHKHTRYEMNGDSSWRQRCRRRRQKGREERENLGPLPFCSQTPVRSREHLQKSTVGWIKHTTGKITGHRTQQTRTHDRNVMITDYSAAQHTT